MSEDPPVIRKQVEISNELGLHVRPARKFVKLAARFQSDIRVCYNGLRVNGKAILDLTLLAAECGTKLDLEARGSDAQEAIDALAALVEDQFGEGEHAGEDSSF